MNWPGYPEYKVSGIEWLGDMPSHWFPARLKNVIQSIDSGTSVNAADWPAGPDEIGVLKTSCVSSGWFNADANKTVVEDDISRVTCPVQGDTVIVNRANTPLLVGSAGYVSHELKNIYLSDKLWQIRFHDALPTFVYYWTQTPVYRSQIGAKCVGASSSMQNLSMVDFGNVALALPPDDEQSSIVNFLSERTAKIDALIDKQEQLIATVREDRTATITHAVTKGLDPDAEVNDSGITWVESMPSTWEVEKVSRIFRANKSPNAATLTKEYCAGFPGDYPVYSGQTAEEGVLARVEFYEFDVGDTGALLSTTVGAKAMSIAHILGRFNLSQNCMVIRSISSVDMRFFYYHFQALFRYERQFVSEHMQASFRMEDLYGFRILVPPLADQMRIAKHLDQRCGRIDALIAKASEMIERLREYRSALITDAVTGKIDVRAAV
jgi:type I restriction enzyme S subunit